MKRVIRSPRSRYLLVLVIIMISISGCVSSFDSSQSTPSIIGGQPAGEGVSATPTATRIPGAELDSRVEGLVEGESLFGMSDLVELTYSAPGLPSKTNSLFATSGTCTLCHQNMQDQAGNNVSTDTLWRGAMMANASRDPYWQASVKSQLINVPSLEDEIEDKCSTCHMPMARFVSAQENEVGKMFGSGFLDPDNPGHTFAMDGVSCALCHQVGDKNFGQESSYSGNFVLDAKRPFGTRSAYGPYPANDRYELIMGKPSGFLPKQSAHMGRSELCATCHTLYTPYVDKDGEIAGLFPEQVPYLEWKQSSFVDEKACQDCHMPPAEGGVVISTTGGETRAPFYRHLFVGGNTYVLRLLRNFGEEIGVTASSDHFDRKIEDTLRQLQHNAARLEIIEYMIQDGHLRLDLRIDNLTGHKFPTAFPSRRAWIHVVVKNDRGEVVYESGNYDDRGKILTGAHDLEPGEYDPHYEVVEDPDQVQIYETVLNDVDGGVTTILLTASGYIKDNRILPPGFKKESPLKDTEVIGEARVDDDFVGGRDQVTYLIDLDGQEGPYTVRAELLYQSIAYRWAINLERDHSAEGDRFIRYYRETPNWPVLISVDEKILSP